jgi:uncharacterized protein YndB with AHSA1/START domain
VSAVRTAIMIARPIDEVFAYVANPRNRGRMLPDNFTDFRVLAAEDAGPGSRFAFTVRTDRGSYESVTETVVCEPPLHMTERTTDGEVTYETLWWFEPQGSATLVVVEIRYPAPGGWINRLLDWAVGQRAQRRSLMIELLRLKQLLESP